MSELATWLLAQIEADAAAARAATGGPWFARGQGGVARDATDMTIAKCGVTHGALEDAAHIARHDPARVLADCAAKKAIVELCASADPRTLDYGDTSEAMAHDILRLLAQPFVGREGWRDEWGTDTKEAGA